MRHIDNIHEIEETMLRLRNRIAKRQFAGRRILPSSLHQLGHILIDHYGETAEPITVSSLADKMNVTRSAVSQLLDVLEDKRVIRRAKSEDDKRVTYVTLTGKGRMMAGHMRRHHGRHMNFVRDLTEYLGPDDTKDMLRIMNRVVDFVDRPSEDIEK